jgi:hypothetical protein
MGMSLEEVDEFVDFGLVVNRFGLETEFKELKREDFNKSFDIFFKYFD